MNTRCALLVLGLLLSAGGHAEVQREAFAQPLPALASDAQLDQFFKGRGLFRQAWVIAPSADESAQGLGPLYNRITCIACHPRNGRGQAPGDSEAPMRSMLVRLSVPGTDAHGGVLPHPVYGDQLNENGIPGVPGEGRAHLDWQYSEVTLDDGQRVELREPRIRFSELAYGALNDVQTSARVGSAVFGLGLLEAVDAQTLQQLASAPKADGVAGRVNWVWSVERQRLEVGRFGLKANQPDLPQQIASALHGDLGITTALYPQQNCTPAQIECQQAERGPQPELDAQRLSALHFYLAHLAAPPRRKRDAAPIKQGEQLFSELGCGQCHIPRLTTGQHPNYPALSRQPIEPYTDLLLHDMGAGLADHRPDYLASGREWRTAPLWGLGLSEVITPGAGYLHDGRARTVTEAILWHDGEARPARERFSALPAAQRELLMGFLRSL
ncbi:di-heme oxidoredictase family protein [Pseudomonas cremoricolorata]|uniref:di-heme oxidoreductase family protein n=1 Tax=Pseudomonas cremoricolorata TaxID=157783 RepID=UPI000427F383|nr:di-heme oxidoredictase family protein [Pseudomonas cremoricolorata]